MTNSGDENGLPTVTTRSPNSIQILFKFNSNSNFLLIIYFYLNTRPTTYLPTLCKEWSIINYYTDRFLPCCGPCCPTITNTHAACRFAEHCWVMKSSQPHNERPNIHIMYLCTDLFKRNGKWISDNSKRGDPIISEIWVKLSLRLPMGPSCRGRRIPWGFNLFCNTTTYNYFALNFADILS